MKNILLVPIFILFFVSVGFAVQNPDGEARGIQAVNADSTEFLDPFDQQPAAGHIDDPLEPMNRALFWLNDKLYTGVLAPICRTVPSELRNALAKIHGFLDKPLHIGGAEFKFAFRDGGSEIGRFLVHSLVGLLHEEQSDDKASLKQDFDKAMEILGIESGFYLVLPVFGPSSLRDGLGRLTSFYLDPSTCLAATGGSERQPTGKSLLGELKLYESVCRQSLDPYLFFRNAYAQQLSGKGRSSFFSWLPHRSPDLEINLICTR